MFKSLICPDEKVTEEQLATDRRMMAFDRSVASLNRRSFLSVLAGAAAAGAIGTMGVRSAEAQSAAPPITDVLNFALNLEYLEANLYILASGAAPLSAADMGPNPGTITGTAPIALTGITKTIAAALAQDERNHIEQLRATITSLGGTPISMPSIFYAANGLVTTQAQFLMAARQFTAVGGSAYAGAAQFLVSNPVVLTAASQILGAEGQHAGVVDYQCIMQGVVGPLDPAVDAIDSPPTTSSYRTVLPVTALAPARTTSQVLGIVYGKSTSATTTPPAGITMGGFFPNGVNGNIKST